MTASDATSTADLEKLADEIHGDAFEARIVTPPGRRPRLHVRNRSAGLLAEDIYSDGQSYWFGWAECIGPVADISTVAEKIMQVLRALDAGHG